MKQRRSALFTLVATLIFSPIVLGLMGTAEAQGSSYISKTGSTLEFLMKMEEQAEPSRLSGEFGETVLSTAQTQNLNVSIRFDHELSKAEIADLEAEGLVFVRIDGEVAHSGTIYGAKLPISAVDVLKERADVLRIESTWKPHLIAPLDMSVPEINADDMWQLLDGGGDNITGEGITVANFDTGIDVFHPDFWNADGGSFAWIDTNSNSTFDPGIDAVDLNGNTSAEATETLDFFDAGGPAGNNDGVFQADMDWLYNDANNNSQRDYGTASGFTEADPTYGELIFIADDTNGNNVLDVGENVLALGTTKVLRTLNLGGTERIRGTDLIQTTDDTNGHGTSVCGIVNGGTIGLRRFVGVAPNAELLVADRISNNFTVYIPWARTNGADVMLYEFGGWIQEFLDGSSNLEQMIDAEAAGGIVQVVAAGNLGNQDKHAEDNVAANGSTNFTFDVPAAVPGGVPAVAIDRVLITALWRDTGNNLAFNLTLPGMIVITVNLPASPPAGWNSTTTADGHTIWYRREDSTRGTAKYDITINRAPVGIGIWTLEVVNNSGSVEHVDMYIRDRQTSWLGGAMWTAFQSNNNTVTYPATADSAITVASYSTRGWGLPPWYPVVAAGDLSTFSPAGPRIDGQDIMDIAAPGNFDIGSAYSKDAFSGSLGQYDWFGGTSAAAPHVAGASALLLQWDPTLNHNQVQTMLQQSARTDAFTGVTPNAEWGHGKLDVLAAVNQAPVSEANGPYQAECQYPSTTITLNGTGSSDPNAGDVLTYAWSTDCSGGSFDDPTSPTPTLSVDSGCFSCNVSLTVTDLAGASDSSSATVTVEDTQDPSINCPADVTIECDQPTDPSNTGTGTATDQCDPNPDVTFSDVVVPGTCPEEETITRTWTATDACGNFTTCVQTIEVVDTTPPVIDSNAPATITPPDAPISFTATATDNCDGDPSVEITGYGCYFFTKKGKRVDKTESCVVEISGDTITILDSGGVDDQIEWTISAGDNCGNATEATHTVSVVNPGNP